MAEPAAVAPAPAAPLPAAPAAAAPAAAAPAPAPEKEKKKSSDKKKKPSDKKKASAKAGARDIWSVIIEQNKQEKKKLGDTKIDTNVLVVGTKGAGKSTLISRFLNPDKQEDVKPTMGLDYVFGRKISGAGQDKHVAHIWELGGGEDQANLMDAVITPENLRNFVAVVVVDLSKPSTVLDSLVFWMDRLRARIDNCLRVMKEKKSTMPDRLKEKAKASFGGSHPDLELVRTPARPPPFSPSPAAPPAADWVPCVRWIAVAG